MSESHGPGTELKKLLEGWPFRITSAPGCSCNRVAQEMDLWGPDECEKPERMQSVLDAMKANAARRNLPWIEPVARLLVRRAIRNSRKESA
jgi:hypothetical protein